MIGVLSRRRRIVGYALGALVLMVLVGIGSNADRLASSESRREPVREMVAIERDLLGSDDTVIEPVDPIEIPESVAVGFAVLLGLGLLYLLSRQRFSFRFRRPSIQIAKRTVVITEEHEADAIATFARDLIDELNEGDSPRYAIQRAYAAVETGFGHPELARKPAETPLRYLDRIFGRHAVVRSPLAQLTELFQRARFSDEPIDEPMRTAAIAALSHIRDHYTSVAWQRIERREQAEAARAAS